MDAIKTQMGELLESMVREANSETFKVSFSMYMEVPLRKNESIDSEEEYRPDKSEVKEMKSLKEPEEKKE